MQTQPLVEGADQELVEARETYRGLRQSLRRSRLPADGFMVLARMDRQCGAANHRIQRARQRLSPTEARRLQKLVMHTRQERQRLSQLAVTIARSWNLEVPRNALGELLEALAALPKPEPKGGLWRVWVLLASLAVCSTEGGPLWAWNTVAGLAFLIAPVGLALAGTHRSPTYRNLVSFCFMAGLIIQLVAFSQYFWLPSILPLVVALGTGVLHAMGQAGERPATADV